MDEDIDKTGYSKMKMDALCKAFKYCTKISEITIGPDACPSTEIKDNETNTITPCSNNIIQEIPQKTSFEFSNEEDDLIAHNEKDEDRYCAKKLLAELNNFCVADGQKMKLSLLKKRLEKLETARQEAERIIANMEAKSLISMQEREERVNSIQNRLIIRQKQFTSSTSISRDNTTKKAEDFKKLEEKKQEIKASEKKRLFDCVYKNEVKFKKAYGEIVEIVTNYKDIKHVIASDVDLAGKINIKFISLICSCKRGDITTADVESSDILLKSIEDINFKITKEKDKFEDELRKRKEYEELLKEEEEEEKLKETTPLTCTELDKTDVKHISSYNYMENYNKVTSFLTEVEQKLKSFMVDESYKKYRSDCQKAVNLPVNAISPCSAAHLNDKLKKLTSLLQGQYVTVADRRVSSSSHPLGQIFCRNLLAEKIVKQGEQVVSSKPDAAFAIATVTVAIWMEFPDFGKLLLAHFYRRCPYLIPVYWKSEEDQTEEEYYKKLGFTYSDGSREDLNMFLKRQGGIVRLFGSIMIADKKQSLRSHKHPLSLAEGWKLIAAFIKLEPKADISATVLLDILEVIGFAMVKAYGIQFHKLLHVICKSYLPRIVEVTAEGMLGGPLCRLKNFLESIAKGKQLQPPKGLLSPNFW